jgi:CRP-like cAMP-binding protein
MTKNLIRKLERSDVLSDEEKDVLERAFTRIRDFRADEDIVREGDRPTESCIIVEGWAARYKVLPSGRRQISAIHISGDFVDLHSFLLKTMDHGVVTLAPTRIAFVPHTTLKKITEDYPHLTRMLWLSTLIDAAIHRTWLTAMGRTSATAQMAHLICELHVRLEVVGLTNGNSFHLPVTQEELGDALGLSTVHVNRVITELRNGGIVQWQGGGAVTILNWDRLKEIAEFTPIYLSLQNEPR